MVFVACVDFVFCFIHGQACDPFAMSDGISDVKYRSAIQLHKYNLHTASVSFCYHAISHKMYTLKKKVT